MNWKNDFIDQWDPFARQFLTSRVSIWDGNILEEELFKVLFKQLQLAIDFGGGASSWTLELGALLKSVMFALGTGRGSNGRNASYGYQLQNLHYQDSKSKGSLSKFKIIALYLLDIAIPYLTEKLYQRAKASLASNPARRMRARAASQPSSVSELFWNHYEALKDAFNLLALALFLRDGKFYRLSERIIGARPVTNNVANSPSSSAASFTDRYFNHSIVLQSFFQLLSLILPLLRLERIISVIYNLIAGNNRRKNNGKRIAISGCGICGSRREPLPLYAVQVKPCNHLFCHNCFEQYRISNSSEGNNSNSAVGMECPVCEDKIVHHEMIYFNTGKRQQQFHNNKVGGERLEE